MNSILLFLNGEWSKSIANLDLSQFNQIICADAAVMHFIKQFKKCPDLVLGDGDSFQSAIKKEHIDVQCLNQLNWIELPDQNFTDFEKILHYLAPTSAQKITIYGATARETDHFLGNIAVAKQFYTRFDLHFYDDYSEFFFVRSPFKICLPKGTTFSCIPMSEVTNFTLTGALYNPQKTLSFGHNMSLRNETAQNELCGSFDAGDLLIVISRLID